MRTHIVDPGADKLRYEIRQIVEIGKKIELLGTPVVWENIGDPVASCGKGEFYVRILTYERIRRDLRLYCEGAKPRRRYSDYFRRHPFL
jgi:alanine-synthesizing transaminase